MSGLFGHLVGVMIVIMMVTFIGIWVWAWRPRHSGTFGALASIPMQDGARGDDDAPRLMDDEEHRLLDDDHPLIAEEGEKDAPGAEREAAS